MESPPSSRSRSPGPESVPGASSGGERPGPFTAAIILAAGASSRMGTPKGLLSAGNRPVLCSMVERLTRAGAWPRVVVIGASAEEYLRRVPASGFRYAVHGDWERGRTGSVQAGLHALSPLPPTVLLWPVDHPFVSASTIVTLVERSRSGKGSWYVPRCAGKRGHPLVLKGNALETVRSYGTDVPLHQYPREHPEEVVEIEVTDSAVLDNVDTPEEFQTGLRAHQEVVGGWTDAF